ncbi:MAG: hypothetical protein ACOX20_01755 [Limnochordia bacterium]
MKIFPAYKDLMDRDPDEVYEDAQKFEQVYELDLTVTPVSGIEVKAGLKGTNVFNWEKEREIKLDSLYLELATEGVLKRLRFGTIPEQNWSDFTLVKYSDEEDDDEDRSHGMYALLGFPSNVSAEAVFERLIGADDGADSEDYDYFGGLRAGWQVNENMRLGGAVLGRMDSVTEKDEEADFLYAFNTELNLGNLGIAGEYAIHEKGNAYQVGANAS